MADINLLGSAFFKELETDVLASVGVSLVRHKKVVTARTVKSVRAVTTFSNTKVTISAFGGEGMPFIIKGKPANTKYPLDYKGTKVGKSGRSVKVFELKPKLKDWKAVTGFGGSDFMLAKAIAENKREPVDIATVAISYLSKQVTLKTLSKFSSLVATEIANNFDKDASI